MKTFFLFVEGRGEFARYDFFVGSWFGTNEPNDALTCEAATHYDACTAFAKGYTKGLRYRDRDDAGFDDINLNSFRAMTREEAEESLKGDES